MSDPMSSPFDWAAERARDFGWKTTADVGGKNIWGQENEHWYNGIGTFSELFKNPISATLTLLIAALAVIALVIIVLYFMRKSEGMQQKSRNTQFLGATGVNQCRDDAYVNGDCPLQKSASREAMAPAVKEADLLRRRF